MKKMKWVGVVLIVILAGLWVARNAWVRWAAVKAVEQATGFGLEIGSLRIGLFTPVVDLRDVRLINPPDFPEPDALWIRHMRVDVDPRSLFGGTVHVREILMDIPQTTLVIKEDGDSNISRLKNSGSKREGGGGSTVEAESESGGGAVAPGENTERREVRIDRLIVRLGTVTVREYENGKPKEGMDPFVLNVDRTYEDITDPRQIATLIGAEILVSSSPRLLEDVQGILDKNDGDLRETGRELKEKFKGLLKQFE